MGGAQPGGSSSSSAPPPGSPVPVAAPAAQAGVQVQVSVSDTIAAIPPKTGNIDSLLRFFKSVGVLTIVLAEMLKDVSLFTIILLTMTFGFAVAFGTLMHHTNEAIAGEEWYRKVMGNAPIWAAFWGVFGGLGNRMLSWSSGAVDEPEYVIRAMAIFVIIFLFVVLIIIRLLVAMLQSTYVRILGESQGFWLFERAQLIAEFKDTKPPLPPPFNVIWYICYSVPKTMYSRYQARHSSDVPSPTTGFKRVPNEKLLRQLWKKEQQYLKVSLDERRKRQAASAAAKTDQQGQAITKLEEDSRTRFETLNGRIDELRSQLLSMAIKPEALHST